MYFSTTAHRFFIHSIATMIISVAAVSASAQQLLNCSEIPAADVPAQLECLDNNYAILDKDLNQTYKNVMATLTDDQKKSLREEQRKWLKKKAACKNKDDSPRGYVGQLVCEVDETQKRVVYLKSMVK